jgi:hypothetical protein
MPDQGLDPNKPDAPPSVPKPLPMPAWVPKATYIVVLMLTVLVLVAHSLKLEAIQVDTTTLGLLALLLLVPLAPYITRLKAGGVEAEIGERDAQRLQAAASELPSTSSGDGADAEDDAAPTLAELIRRDPPLGLAKLRIDLEREIRQLYLTEVENPMRRGFSLGPMIRELVKHRVLPPEISYPLIEVNELCNRAVHGEYVPRDVAEEIADVGERLLHELRSMNSDLPTAEPERT